MENLGRKYFIKLINNVKQINNIKKTKLVKWFKCLITQWSIQRRWNALFYKNYSSGYLIESLQIKFILMYNEWPEYKNSGKQKNMLKELIDLSEELLIRLEEEEKISHLRSVEYIKLQKLFFEKINIYSEDLFY